MLWFCGFNGFNQFNNITENIDSIEEYETFIPKFVRSNAESCEDIHTSWSNILLINGGKATLHGFLNGKIGQSLTLEVPDKQTIVQGRCSRSKCFFVSSNGKCWQFSLDTMLWEEIHCFNVIDSCISNSNIVKIALSETFSAALTDHGTAWTLGSKLSYPNMKVQDIECGIEHGILLTVSGDVYTWGGGSRGQLGNGTLGNSEDLGEVPMLAGMKVRQIAAGGWHCAVVSGDGDVYTWGWNKQGQLGHPTLEEYNEQGVAVLSEPRLVDWPNSLETSVRQVSCGTSHTIILLENGDLWGCGWNKWGQLGTRCCLHTHLLTKMEVSEDVLVTKAICSAWNTILITQHK